MVICILAKFNQIREFMLFQLCGDVNKFPEPDYNGFTQSLVLWDAKKDQSVVQY